MRRETTVMILSMALSGVEGASRVARAAEEMSPETRHNLVKAHGILMVISWLFLIPSAMLFARMLRDSFKHRQPFGLAVWFHVHRTFNIIAILLMTASFFCVFIATGWTWKGVFSKAKSPTQLHTTTGVFAFGLAVLQPFLSLLRCGANDKRRPIFNWSHRLIGFVAYILALIALVVAATEFKKLWTDAALQTVLMVLPTVLLFVLWPATALFLPTKENEDKKETESFLGRTSSKYAKIQQENLSVRLSLCFWAIGMMLATTLALSLLIGAGYKPKAH